MPEGEMFPFGRRMFNRGRGMFYPKGKLSTFEVLVWILKVELGISKVPFSWTTKSGRAKKLKNQFHPVTNPLNR